MKCLNAKKDSGTIAEYLTLENFGLDIAVFIKLNNGQCIARFFELKAYVGSRKGGVGFGNGVGRGSQVDLLLLENSQLKLSNQFIRWILVDGTKPTGCCRFAIFNNSQAKEAAMGGVESKKQNNLNVDTLMGDAKAKKWSDLIEAIEEFLG